MTKHFSDDIEYTELKEDEPNLRKEILKISGTKFHHLIIDVPNEPSDLYIIKVL